MINDLMLYLASDAPAEDLNPFEQCFVILILIIGFGFWARNSLRNRLRASEAASHARELTASEVDTYERQILEVLHNSGLAATVAQLAEQLGLHKSFILVVVERMSALGYLEVQYYNEYDTALDEFSTIRLTLAGDRRLKEAPPVSHYHGDYIHAEQNAIVTNRSVVLGSYNEYASRYDAEIAAALAELEDIVRRHGSQDGIENLEGFLDEARSPSPSRARLRALFSGIQQAVPTLVEMTNLIEKVARIFA